MYNIFNKIALFLGIILGIIIFILAVLAYFVFSFDGVITYDGLGRRLTESPWFVRIIFGEERLWAGWLWFIADIVIFWSAVIASMNLISFGIKEGSQKP